jgi:hypothetical protein
LKKELTDLEKRPDYRNGKDRTTSSYASMVWFKRTRSYRLNAFGNETIESECGVKSSGKKKQKIKKLRKEDLNAACKDKSTTIKFQKIDYITD